MANVKISALTELTAPAAGDYIPIVDISEAADADKTKRITFANLAAWTAYTATVTASSGTFTTVAGAGRYTRIGSIVHYQVEVAITNKGTADEALYVTIPVTAGASGKHAIGCAITNSNLLGHAQIVASGNTLMVWKYDGTTIIDNLSIYIDVQYEV